jgi:hypothetical protein
LHYGDFGFQGKDIPAIQVSHQIRFAHRELWKSNKIKPPRTLKALVINKNVVWRLFGDHCQQTPRICGVGGILFTSDNRA